MNRQWMQIAVAVVMAAPAGSAAQATPRPSPAPRARTRVEAPFTTFTFSGNRGRIGVVVNTAADADSDKLGARIDAVTPGGPAAKAGLKAGDVITRFNTTSLAGARAEDEDENQSGPGMKLIELARELDPGDTVQLEYRRGGDTKKATLVAEEIASAGVRRGMGMGEGMPWIGDMRPPMATMIPGGPEIAEGFSFCFGEE